jgi:hypothetical protein
MSKKVKKTEQAVASMDSPVEELPDFAFIGTDGETYHIGKTPHSFVMSLKHSGMSTTEISYETLDHWLWLHLRCVDGQHHIKPEDVEGLYFQCDIPQIVDFIFRRLVETKASTLDALKNMGQRLTELLGDASLGEEENRSL